MAMSRKHYREAAEKIKGTVEQSGYVTSPETLRVARDIAMGLADMFKADNSAFRREQFMDACGLGDPNGN